MPQAVPLAVSASLGGFVKAAVVLRWGSIWPAVLFHGLLNAAVSAVAVNTPGFEETVPGWLLVIALELPIALLGAYLLRRVRPRPVIPEAD